MTKKQKRKQRKILRHKSKSASRQSSTGLTILADEAFLLDKLKDSAAN